jgi:hydrogenase maturation protease
METLITDKPTKSKCESPLRTLIVGVGNPHHHDEQVGLYVARRLREKSRGSALESGAIEVREIGGDVFDLMKTWQDADLVFVVDAVTDGRVPGTIYYFEVCRGKGCPQAIPSDLLLASTNSLGLDELISIAEALDKLPPRLIIFSIEVEEVEPGEGLSIPVLAAAEQIVTEILAFTRFNLAATADEMRLAEVRNYEIAAMIEPALLAGQGSL